MTRFKRIARGEEIKFPNSGKGTLHPVHACNVAKCFMQLVTHRESALGEMLEATNEEFTTLYGYAVPLYACFGREPGVDFLP